MIGEPKGDQMGKTSADIDDVLVVANDITNVDKNVTDRKEGGGAHTRERLVGVEKVSRAEVEG